MTEPLIVWVVTQGCYSSQGVTGVYASAEAAMADQATTGRDCNGKQAAVKWSFEHGAWDNNFDWDDAISIQPYPVKP